MDPTPLQQAIAGGPEPLFNYLWHTKYLPIIQKEIELEVSRRADAFAPAVTFTVCGEELRLMTPNDYTLLEGLGNRFLSGPEMPDHMDLLNFLWVLHEQNDGTKGLRRAWRFGRFRSRVARWVDEHFFEAAIKEVCDYIDRVFIDCEKGAPPPQPNRLRPSKSKLRQFSP